MNCPVCKTSDLSDDIKTCPQCQSDLEAFQITKAMDRSNKNRLTFGILASILFVTVLILWIFTGFTGKAKSIVNEEVQQAESHLLSAQVEQLQSENTQLKSENSKLQGKLSTTVEEKKKREKIYVVKSGESMYSVARKVYGNGYKYVDLAKDNNIENPDQLIAGQKLVIYY